MSKKFLIGQLACYGDCLYATTIAKQIKHDYHNCHITWAIASKYKSILDLNPYIDSVWEVYINDDDYYDIGWKLFEKEAFLRKEKGEFDVIIFSQISPLNWINFNGTIRGTILSTYKRRITETVTPVIRLSKTEVEHVRSFALKNRLQQYKNVILFECNPGSSQSKITPELAIEIAEKITEKNKDICFILTLPNKLNLTNTQIIDASKLTFRENAELTKYCTLLIGCSSGITWLTTSDWAKKLPMLQLLDFKLPIYAGVHFDFELNNLDNSRIIEMGEFDFNNICRCIWSLLSEDFLEVKKKFHENYKPNTEHLYIQTRALIYKNYSLLNIIVFAYKFIACNYRHKNKLELNYVNYMKWFLRKYMENHF